MAGGRGERFWPKSRKTLPKQFLSRTGDGKTMIQLTVERILPLVEMDDIYIVTNKDYRQLVREQLPEIPERNILCEPVGRNTAPCIGLGAMHINQKYDDAVMMVLPSDHLIKQKKLFVDILGQACEIAEEDGNIVTVGITPSYPETGYGYIKFLTEKKKGSAFKVEKFVEKPNMEKAKEYLASGDYLWNSGMFMWKVSTILNKMQTLLPQIYQKLTQIGEALGTPEEDKVLQEVFPTVESISVDYGILEKTDSIYTLPGDFGWDDVGSWLAVSRVRGTDENNNVLTGNVLAVDTTDCVVEAQEKLIATVGLKNLVVVDTKDAMLICEKEKANDIKKVLETLRNDDRQEYL